jgi:hypothetical protein
MCAVAVAVAVINVSRIEVVVVAVAVADAAVVTSLDRSEVVADHYARKRETCM